MVSTETRSGSRIKEYIGKASHDAPRRNIAAGHVYLEPHGTLSAVEPKSQGGIHIASTAKSDWENGKVKYGAVIGCGQYQNRQQQVVEGIPDWPLPVGTLVEYKVNNPFLTPHHEVVIQSIDICAYFLPGKWPDYIRREKEFVLGGI